LKNEKKDKIRLKKCIYIADIQPNEKILVVERMNL